MWNFHSTVYQLEFIRWQYNQLLVGYCTNSSDSTWWNDHTCVDICIQDAQIMSFYSVCLAHFAYMLISTIQQKSFCNWYQMGEAAQYYLYFYCSRHVKTKLVWNWDNQIIAWSLLISTFRGLVIDRDVESLILYLQVITIFIANNDVEVNQFDGCCGFFCLASGLKMAIGKRLNSGNSPQENSQSAEGDRLAAIRWLWGRWMVLLRVERKAKKEKMSLKEGFLSRAGILWSI